MSFHSLFIAPDEASCATFIHPEGLSVRSVFFNVFQSVIVLLYVLDNDTNTIVRISVGIGLLIECWKVCIGCQEMSEFR